MKDFTKKNYMINSLIYTQTITISNNLDKFVRKDNPPIRERITNRSRQKYEYKAYQTII